METSEADTKIYTIKVDGKDIIVIGGTPMVSCPALFKALAKARDKAERALKDKKNAFHGYDYVSAENVIGITNEALESSGLHMLELGHTVVSDGGSRYLITSWVLTHESGEVFPLKDTKTPIVVEKGKPEDKAQFAAMTESLAYRCRSLLLIQRGGPDVSGRDDTGYDPKAGAGQKANSQQRDNGPQNVTRIESQPNTNTGNQNRSSAQPAANMTPMREPTADNIAVYQSLVAQVEKYGLQSAPVQAIIAMIEKAPDDVKELSEAYRKAGKKHAGLMAMVVMGHEKRVINLLPKPDATSDPEI